MPSQLLENRWHWHVRVRQQDQKKGNTAAVDAADAVQNAPKNRFSRESVPQDLQRAIRILQAFHVERLGWREIRAVDAFPPVIVLVLLDDILVATITSRAVEDRVWR